MSLRFIWNRNKAATNIRDHRVSFDEAASVFDDILALIFTDEEHSEDEFRELIIGYSNQNRPPFVCFTERDGSIRLISARLAKGKELDLYETTRR
ncbi:MAG: BrnT family toxin [Caldilineaceae bacterium]|nr:BrnT family toxin [Caldilineaceae bacterium]HRJ45139.1 BrnT family toxin [Caldilineaceae bacterium]